MWAGDLAIVVWSQFATIGDSISMRNALDTLFDVQSERGQFPWAGPPICHDSVSELAKSGDWPYISDSYHLWTMLVARHFFHLTGDLEWLKAKWQGLVLGMQLTVSRVRFTSKPTFYVLCLRCSFGLMKDYITPPES